MIVTDFAKLKKAGQKISMLTCYDFCFAELLEKTQIDCLLVGDSVAMVQHGHLTTLPATVEMMAAHVSAVRRGCPSKFIVADMPFLAHRKGRDSAIEAVRQLMAAGAQAIKIEGAKGHTDFISYVVESGVPVMGHLGLTPQSVHQLGGFKVQARGELEQIDLIDSALALQASGVFALVVECVPASAAALLTERLAIPTIGIGAGSGVDGQVLVLNDLLGLSDKPQPKFVRKYLDGAGRVQAAIEQYITDVRGGAYPSESESYS